MAKALDEVSLKTIREIWQPIIDQRIVILARKWFGSGVASLGITTMQGMGVNYIRALTTKDDTDKYSTIAFMYQKDVHPIFEEYYYER